MTDSYYQILVDEDADEHGAVLLDLPPGIELAIAGNAVVSVFVSEPAVETVRLRVADSFEGIVTRRRITELTDSMVRLGDADGATLPGPSNQYRILHFRCLEPSCPVEQRRIHVDPRSVPQCRLGHGAMLVVR
ncbi:hypothetical protein [Streptomyces sp. ok210]|jgi:hypothetical protein|uniref:hypothetical protein n=1 Tax=Streptomyces sp. ok210 TaxID=1761905 RepID=UPI0008F220A5|nr:hypothetical protein [Streptomyces sp. ok210]SFT31450.1 hypothetical protein SAMN04487982_11986 [Streptomyces sp. ok210]